MREQFSLALCFILGLLWLCTRGSAAEKRIEGMDAEWLFAKLPAQGLKAVAYSVHCGVGISDREGVRVPDFHLFHCSMTETSDGGSTSVLYSDYAVRMHAILQSAGVKTESDGELSLKKVSCEKNGSAAARSYRCYLE